MNQKAYYLHLTVSQSWLDRFDSTAFSAEHWYCPEKITKVRQKKILVNVRSHSGDRKQKFKK
jgi:hypothetical protein